MDLNKLKEKPFFLNGKAVQWVGQTLDSLDTRKKVGQLFCPLAATYDNDTVEKIFRKIGPGGMMNRPQAKEEMWQAHQSWQEMSEIPLLIPANLESGGNGVAKEGTVYSMPMGIAATDNPEMAFRLGLICGREAAAVGCNWSFAPVVDIDMNFLNPITNVRTYGSDPERVKKMAGAYVRGLKESGIIATIKHWPGDGTDDRDQHLVMTKNLLSVDKWRETYGAIYKELIDLGVPTVMAAHIAFPAYMKEVIPGISTEDILPATLTPELNNQLLREELGFNGLVVSDASVMFGLTAKARRSEIVPRVVAAGCDIFLFNQDVFEDYESMLKGVESGIVTDERLNEAVTRILALKACLNLHEKQKQGTLVPEKSRLEIIGCREHVDWARECADNAITLVKDTQNLLPISPEKTPKVILFGFGEFRNAHEAGNKPITEDFKETLNDRGFEVVVFDKEAMGMKLLFSSAREIKDKYDLAIYLAVIPPYSNAGSLRISWMPPLGFDIPWFLNEIPVLFISCANPYHLYDVPDIKTFINTYTYSTVVLEELMDKLTGKKQFNGKNPVDPFCGIDDAKI